MGQCQLGSLAITPSARELHPRSVSLYTGYIKEQSGLWLQVPSDRKEELAGTGNTDVFRFPVLWKHLRGLCSYSAVAACLPPLPGSLCGQM